MADQTLPEIWEDDNLVYIPEKLFEFLPKELRKDAEARKLQGEKVLRIVDRDMKGFVNLINVMPTVSSLSYTHSRLRKAKFEPTTESIFEQEMLTTAFVVTYARLFARGNGTTRLKASDIPEHLAPVHEHVMELRNERYAHNDKHETVGSGLQIHFDESGFHLLPEVNFGFHVGGRDEWEELVSFVQNHVHERLTKITQKLKQKTGFEWTFPTGPVPDWVSEKN